MKSAHTNTLEPWEFTHSIQLNEEIIIHRLFDIRRMPVKYSVIIICMVFAQKARIILCHLLADFT